MKKLHYSWMAVLALVLLAGFTSNALAAEEKCEGKIKTVTADKNQMVVTDKNDEEQTIQVNDKTTIQLNSKEAKLKDLKAGDEVKVEYEKKGDNMIATKITATRKRA